MNKGIIYLVQPVELVGTQRYKPGFSNSPNLKGLNRYKKGVRYLRIAEVDEAKKLKTKILNEFKKRFKLIAGNEYFEGDEIAIIDVFDEEVRKHRNECNRNSNDIEKELEPLNEFNLDLILDGTIKNQQHHIPEKFENNIDVQSAGWVCSDCDKKFATKQSLQYHIKTGVCKKNHYFECDFCGKVLSSASSLSIHRSTSCKVMKRIKDRELFVDKMCNKELFTQEFENNGQYNPKLDKIYDMLVKIKEENAELKDQTMQIKRDNENLRSEFSKKYNTINNQSQNINNSEINNGTVNNTINNIYLSGYMNL